MNVFIMWSGERGKKVARRDGHGWRIHGLKRV